MPAAATMLAHAPPLTSLLNNPVFAKIVPLLQRRRRLISLAHKRQINRAGTGVMLRIAT